MSQLHIPTRAELMVATTGIVLFWVAGGTVRFWGGWWYFFPNMGSGSAKYEGVPRVKPFLCGRVHQKGISMYVCMYVCMYIYIYILYYIYMYVYIYMYICIICICIQTDYKHIPKSRALLRIRSCRQPVEKIPTPMGTSKEQRVHPGCPPDPFQLSCVAA